MACNVLDLVFFLEKFICLLPIRNYRFSDSELLDLFGQIECLQFAKPIPGVTRGVRLQAPVSADSVTASLPLSWVAA